MIFRYSLIEESHRCELGCFAWRPPIESWFKLNVDGSMHSASGACGCGGVIRDDQGNWVLGFTLRCSHTDILLVQLEAINAGLSLAWEHGYRLL